MTPLYLFVLKSQQRPPQPASSGRSYGSCSARMTWPAPFTTNFYEDWYGTSRVLKPVVDFPVSRAQKSSSPVTRPLRHPEDDGFRQIRPNRRVSAPVLTFPALQQRTLHLVATTLNVRGRLPPHQPDTRDPVRPKPTTRRRLDHATSRRSATMAGSSGTGFLPHSFHHGRGNGGGGG